RSSARLDAARWLGDAREPRRLGAASATRVQRLRTERPGRDPALPDRVGLQDQSPQPVLTHLARAAGALAQSGGIHDLPGSARPLADTVLAARRPSEH